MVLQPVQPPHARRVLVVDDEPLVRWALSETLTTAGLSVRQAATGDAAARALSDEGNCPDVVLLDYRLPDTTGLDLLATIKRETPSCRTILMTAYGTPEIARQALQMGAVAVVDKPFEMGDVPGIVEYAFHARLPDDPGEDRARASVEP